MRCCSFKYGDQEVLLEKVASSEENSEKAVGRGLVIQNPGEAGNRETAGAKILRQK